MAKKKTYTPAPEVPTELQTRYRAVLEVLSGSTSVAEAARQLGMSRNHFQTLMHRGLEGMIQGLSPGKAGRPAKPQREVELEAERDMLQRKNQQLEERLDMTTRLMGLASELIKGSTARPRSPKRSAKVTSPDDKSEEPPPSLRDVVRRLEHLGLPRPLLVSYFDVADSTLRRWSNAPPKPPRVRSISPPDDVEQAAIRDIRELRGLVGAESLRRAHDGLSRRQAARIKQETLTAMERERRGASSRVIVTAPGVVRGFDAMDRGHASVPRYVLVAADGCVPYRTSVVSAERYDDEAVAHALAADFEKHGAPLVLRLDRAKPHQAPRTASLLAANQVLVLHGPPRHPRFYGQLERQNREHSAWVHASDDGEHEPLQVRLDAMRAALNTRWLRRSLCWRTPEEAWRSRPHIDVDRVELRIQRDTFARKLRVGDGRDKITNDLAARLAIEHVLTNLGYLRIEIRKTLLGDIDLLKTAI